ncbi:retinol dehydrogenase 11 [Periophthalmus magnuspinnatus]|uniref:Ketoreductase domain-containing protein n=1 Tax=Periophthalmus magnuspinnatus TaxID=409849 RepID=A0A3B4AHP9_9GOBI|nr:retinol dehydrogenase 11 [Periophthalmus magnuspinnatus]
MSAWWNFLRHPLWAACTLVLALVVRVQRTRRWDPRTCPVNLRGKTAIVTGANTGIGFQIALDLARRGARVILACRSLERGRAARDQIQVQTGNHQVLLRILDLASLHSIREFAQKIHEEEPELHLLVNNAGVSGMPKNMSEDGFDLTFAINHLGPFYLTNLLLDLLKCGAPSRIVILSSSSHSRGQVDFRHFRGEHLVHKSDSVYCHTKLHNILWSNELARRLQGTGVSVNSVHPGVVMTEVMRYHSFRLQLIFKTLGFFFFKTPEEGAVAPLFCAVSEEMEGVSGKYIDSDLNMTLPSTIARDSALGQDGYEYCLKLTSNL